METTTTKHPQQRRYCDRDEHGSGDDQGADRWCYDYHLVKLPEQTERPRCCALHSSRPWDTGPCET